MVKKKKRKFVKAVKKAVTKKKKKVVAKKAKLSARKKPQQKKSIKKKPIKKIIAPVPEGTFVGKVTHYFPHVKAGAILIEKGYLALGDVILIKGHTSDFKQKITSMQIDRAPVEKASKGQEIGILVKSRVRIRDKVYKI